MSIPILDHGRAQQKRRTYDALLDAARALLAEGVTPTVEDAASAAFVSRTTAYRYFPNGAALLAAIHPVLAAESLLDEGVGDDPVERVDIVLQEVLKSVVESEAQYRATLRRSLELDADQRKQLPLRQGRVVGWIRDALAPLESDVEPEVLISLASAIRSAAGIEALVWLTDVAGMERTDAVELMRWSARALVREFLAGNVPPTFRTSAF